MFQYLFPCKNKQKNVIQSSVTYPRLHFSTIKARRRSVTDILSALLDTKKRNKAPPSIVLYASKKEL
uniref:Uncharacterized protein n=1 Tax=Caenorhabditis japonica TaxID=281687 RepID=A0A8R1ETF4_CAEJA